MTVSHLHYTAWPDHGVPDNVMSLIAFIRHVRKLHPVSHQQPLLVHCSAGVGRTGTLILLDIIMQLMNTEGTIYQCSPLAEELTHAENDDGPEPGQRNGVLTSKTTWGGSYKYTKGLQH